MFFSQDRKCVDIISIVDPCVAMKFGRFGREDNTLILVTSTGSLIVQILKRTSTFNTAAGEDLAKKFSNLSGGTGASLASAASSGAAAGGAGTGNTAGTDLAKLIIPKKTKLFVDQTMREREQFLGKFKAFKICSLNFKP